MIHRRRPSFLLLSVPRLAILGTIWRWRRARRQCPKPLPACGLAGRFLGLPAHCRTGGTAWISGPWSRACRGPSGSARWLHPPFRRKGCAVDAGPAPVDRIGPTQPVEQDAMQLPPMRRQLATLGRGLRAGRSGSTNRHSSSETKGSFSR
jgi:hypothetical protein